MKLFVQIPCFNEAPTLPVVLRSIPKEIDGVDSIEVLVIDDGSVDGTSQVAIDHGVDHVLKLPFNKGLANAFNEGVEYCLKHGADIIVNTDGDNQYASKDIANLLKPIFRGEAEIVIGDRGGLKNKHFPYFKRLLQVFGSKFISMLLGLSINDCVSGFRAITSGAAMQINICSDFSYTIEMLVQASSKKIRVCSVSIHSNPKTRDSRLFKSVPHFLKMSFLTVVRTYTMNKPLRVFGAISVISLLAGLVPVGRFLFYYFIGEGTGHIQSLVLGSMLTILGVLIFVVGLVADIISFNRKLLEKNTILLRRIERILTQRGEG